MFSGISKHRHVLLGLVIALLLCTRSAMAQFTINIDEYGNGSLITASGASITIPSLGNVVDPFDPASGIKPLGYNLVGIIPGVVAFDGDVLLSEPQNPTTPSDLLRWTHGLLLVYSDKPEAGEINPPPADVGLPTQFQANALAMLEVGPEAGPNGLFGYAPAPGQPGFYPVPPGPATYNFLSDGVLPEPASLGVIGLGLVLLLRRRRR
jgi:hypothetical protein